MDQRLRVGVGDWSSPSSTHVAKEARGRSGSVRVLKPSQRMRLKVSPIYAAERCHEAVRVKDKMLFTIGISAGLVGRVRTREW